MQDQVCAHSGCGRPATRAVTVRGRHRETGELHESLRALCDQHYDDLMTPCAADGCDSRPDVAVKIVGTSARTGAPTEDEVRLCDTHWRLFQESQAVAIDGITMVHDGQGNLKRLSLDVGQG